MDLDLYLNFFYESLKNHKILEETKILKFLNNTEITEKEIFKKEIEIEKVIIKVKLKEKFENKITYLLIQDLPINFFLSFGIIIGDKVNLVSFITKNNLQYICSQEVFRRIKKKLNYKSFKTLHPKELQLKEFEYGFNQLDIIKNILSFSLEKQKINLNKIHMVESKKIENFLPTIKNSHFRIAKNLKLPLIPLIKDNFIISSIINLYDFEIQIEKLKPIYKFSEKMIFDFHKKLNQILYKDIKKELYLEINYDFFEEKIKNDEKNKLNKEKIFLQLIKLNSKNKKIFYFLNDKIILEKDRFEKETEVEKVIVKIELKKRFRDKKTYILVEDKPLNFFISFGLLFGDKLKLILIQLNEEINYICSYEVFQKIKNKIDFINSEIINVKEFYLKEFIFNFDRIEILKHLTDFVLEKKNLNLNEIHIINSEKIENFVPNINKKHFKIAKNLGIPLISLIKNQTLRTSKIKIIDTKIQIEKLNPIFKFNEIEVLNFDKKTNNLLYKDIQKNIFIDLEKKLINKKLENIKFKNINMEKLLLEISKIKKIKISGNDSNIIIPLFKSHLNQNFFQIKDLEDFFKLTGLRFKLDKNYLNNLYIQTIKGEKLIFKEFYLNSNLKKIFDDLKIEKNIEYNSNTELIIKLIINKKYFKIIKNNNINKNLEKQFINFLKDLLKKTILKSIEFNKLPKKVISNSLLEKYYLSKINSLNEFYFEFLNNDSKELLLSEIIKFINKFNIITKNFKFEFSYLYFYNQIILILIKILSVFNYKISIEIQNLFFQYFKEEKLEISKILINKELENLIEDIAFLKKITKRKKVYIKIKKKFDINLLPKDFRNIFENPLKIYLKPNKIKLKKVFPYSYLEISKKIEKLDFKKLNEDFLFRDKKIELKKEYYYKFYKFKNLKIIFENQFFLVAIKKPVSL